MKDSTSVDLGTNQQLAKASSDFTLDPYLMHLLWKEPFFSRILRSITKIKSYDIPTAGVLANADSIRMWWNPDFVSSLPDEHIIGLIKHECYHLIFKHTTDRKMTPHNIWNIATDLAINSIIPFDELPEGGLVPGRRLPELKDDAKSSMKQENIERYERLSQKFANFPTNKTSEYYFSQLIDDEDLEEITKEGDEGAPGSGSSPGSGIFDSMDSHDKWEELSDEEKELANAKLSEIVKEAAEEANSKGWGSVPSSIRRDIALLYSKRISWESILKQFSGTSNRQERLSTHKRLNRKYPGIHPGNNTHYTSEIAVYIDESGSMSDHILGMIYQQLEVLSNRTRFFLYKFDTQVDKEEVLWKKGRSISLSRSRSGGTNFDCVVKHINKNSSRFDGYIVVTDGYASEPTLKSRVKRCWLITPDGELQFSPPKRDLITSMKND